MMYHRYTKAISATILIAALLLTGACSSTDSGENGKDVNFESGTIAPGETFSYTFETEGEVDYYCQIHAPNMQASLTVSSSANSAERDTVLMQGTQFVPSTLTIAPNTEVVWINESDLDHTVDSGNPSGNGNGGDY